MNTDQCCIIVKHRCINSEGQVTQLSTCCTVVPSICGSSVWSMPDVTVLVPRILRWHLNFWKICELLF
jgi:hypothetical protein